MDIISPGGYLNFMNKVGKIYARYLTPVCKQWELTSNEMDVLLFLYNNPEFDRAADVVSRRGITKSHVSLSVTGLEQKELIIKSVLPADRRTTHLKLTERGFLAAEEGRKAQHAFFETLCGCLTPEEFESWMILTKKIWNSIDDLSETKSK